MTDPIWDLIKDFPIKVVRCVKTSNIDDLHEWDPYPPAHPERKFYRLIISLGDLDKADIKAKFYTAIEKVPKGHYSIYGSTGISTITIPKPDTEEARDEYERKRALRKQQNINIARQMIEETLASLNMTGNIDYNSVLDLDKDHPWFPQTNPSLYESKVIPAELTLYASDQSSVYQGLVQSGYELPELE